MKSEILKLDIEIFKNLIKESTTWTEVMIYFKENHGYKSLNGRTANKRCKDNNIDISHFTHKSKNTPSKKPITEKLIKNSNSYNSSHLKKQLYEKGLLKEICRSCGIGPLWNNKPISLHLEHINGNHYDNRLENLEILCPNCHSQTDTWCIKNKIKKEKLVKKCINCNIKISNKATRCLSCSSKFSHPRKITNRPSVKQLKKDLEKLPYTKVGKKYGVSDNCIRKWIKIP